MIGATLHIGVPSETRPRETRVAATPTTVTQLVGLGYDVVVESGAGAASSFPDDAFAAAGARIGSGEGVVGEAAGLTGAGLDDDVVAQTYQLGDRSRRRGHPRLAGAVLARHSDVQRGSDHRRPARSRSAGGWGRTRAR